MSYRGIVTLVFVAFAIVELFAGRLIQRDKTTKKDVIIEAASGVLLPLVVVPGIFTAVPTTFPAMRDVWSDLHPALMFVVLLLADDLTQYWWHRASHSHPALYRLHRAHHSAEYLSVRIVYRNNLFYYAMMPGLWLSAFLVHAGFGAVYVPYIVAKMAVIIGAHSSVQWDRLFIRNRFLHPLLWVLERTISTPATHAAHHGKHAGDGVTNYHGNYGNFLFFWDVLFGTAKITRRYPDAYGLENIEPATWDDELAWPASVCRRSTTRAMSPDSVPSMLLRR